MRIAAITVGFLMLCISTQAFFDPLTTEQRITNSTLIAVIEVTRVDDEKGQSKATVIQAVHGTQAGQSIEVWDDWQIEANGSESRISGRDPNLVAGKRYLIYLTNNKRGRLVTVQSSLDSIEVNGDRIKKEGQKTDEALADEIAHIRTVIARKKKAEPQR
jgi:hypothetical protein